MNSDFTNIVVLVPTYNESQNIEHFLSSLNSAIDVMYKDSSYEWNILHIDDSSPDGTAQLVQRMNLKRVTQLIRPHKEGLGPAYKAGFAWALKKGADLVVQIDADGSHDPAELIRLLSVASKENIVLGTRWMPGGKISNWTYHRRLISRFGTWVAGQAIGSQLRDLTTGYRVIGREALLRLNLDVIDQRGYGFQIALIKEALSRKIEVREVPITFSERTQGSSKMTLGIVLEATRMCGRWAFQRALQPYLYRR